MESLWPLIQISAKITKEATGAAFIRFIGNAIKSYKTVKREVRTAKKMPKKTANKNPQRIRSKLAVIIFQK